MADVTTFLGGIGTKADAGLIPGVCTQAAWAASLDATDFMGANGGYLVDASTTADITDNLNGTLDVASLNAFSAFGNDELAGCYIYIYNCSGVATGYYLITSNSASLVICSDTNLIATGYTSSASADFYIGGAGDTTLTAGLQAALDHLGTYVANGTNNVDILYNEDLTLTATIDIDNIVGSATTMARLIGTDSSFADTGDQITIDTTTTLSDGLFDFPASGSAVYITFENIDFYGGGKDASRAAHCVNESATGGASDNIIFVNCTFRGASDHGVLQESDSWSFYGCTFTLNGGSGFYSLDGLNNEFIGNKFIDNDEHGLYSTGARIRVIGNIAQGNGQDSSVGYGFYLDNEFYCIGNTAKDNYADGFFADSSSFVTVMCNNTSSGSETGYGFNLDGRENIIFFGHNHAYDNTGNGTTITHCSEVLDTGFAAYKNGDNITGDPNLNATTYIPDADSPLIDAGVGGTGDTIGALCATAGGGGSGGRLMRARRHNV